MLQGSKKGIRMLSCSSDVEGHQGERDDVSEHLLNVTARQQLHRNDTAIQQTQSKTVILQ